MNPAKEKDEFSFKILVIGDVGTGKTSIIKRYVHDVFSDQYRATVRLEKILNQFTPMQNILISDWGRFCYESIELG